MYRARDLHCIEQIGRGTYGTVWKAFNASRRLVAVKRLTMEKETEGVRPVVPIILLPVHSFANRPSAMLSSR